MSYRDLDKRQAGTGATDKPRAGMNWPRPHHGMVSEYQQSGIPFVYYKSVSTIGSDQVVTLTLPYVSRWIKLTLGGTMTGVKVGFADIASAGIQGDNYITGATMNAITVPLELKCKVIKIFIPNASDDVIIELVAGLTNVRDFPAIESEADIPGISTAAAVSGVSSAIYAIGNKAS